MTAPSEADRKQARAAHPATHAWVDASAGSGKTKVLTDRVLRLLLTGAEPHRILCLTFTKAAAANMSNRLMDRLAKWATLPNDQIQDDLHRLTGLVPETENIDKARSLFAALLDAPGGLQFQTIHSFCQSLLARFPLEAGVPLGFGVCDDRTSRALLDSAEREIFAAAAANPQGALEQALEHLLSEFSEDQFRKLTGEIIGARSQLTPLLATGLSAKLREHLELSPDTTADQLLKNFCSRDDSALRAALPVLLANADKKTEQKAAAALTAWLEQTPLQRERSLAAYLGWLLVEGGSKTRAVIVTTAITSKHPAITDLLKKEQEAALRLSLSLRNFRCLKLTEAMLLYANELLTRYQRLKRERLTLDYEDLIEEAVQLVHRQDALWVLYKLDGGIDHVLVDEAQDTNERQWLLLRRLTGDFFAGQGASENEGRTLFAVGDYKQSIYSFQGADPDAFINERAHYLQKAKAVEQAFAQEVFQVSFRSAQPVLDVVNSIFTGNPQTRDSLLDFPPHESAPLNRQLAGRVELWPLAPASVAEEAPWLIPDRVRPYLAPRSRLAQIIARQIYSWCFVERREIPSRGRVMQPGDVLILVRTRGTFVPELVKACKQLGLPVAGVDRMKLTEQLAVEDLLALLDVLLLPEDDLALATVLKGPLCALTEEALCTLAHSRDTESLWHRLQSRAKTDPQLATLTDYLRGLMSEVDSVTPYALLASVLARPCPAGSASGRKAMLTRLGAEAGDPLDELLASCLDFEQNETPSLQSFLRWIRKDATEIKRELHQPMGQVRIMTVHGAKGLEAPVVILADGRERPKDKKRLLLDRRVPDCLPFIAASNDDEPELLKNRRHVLHGRDIAEYHRLLYVALTRAEDWLVVAGWDRKKTGKSKEKNDEAEAPARSDPDKQLCWYDLVAEGMSRLPGAAELDFNTSLLDAQYGWSGRTLVYETAQAGPLRKEKLLTLPGAEKMEASLPDWTQQLPAAEPAPTRPLTPSRLLEEEPPVLSPLAGGEDWRYRRGHLIHRLLQTLPELPEPERAASARLWLAAHAPDAEGERALAETLRIITDPIYAPLFGPGSRAEVPVVGQVGNQTLSGRIDRLAVTADTVWIVDYKTNRLPPARVEDIPLGYIRQLAAYRAVLQPLYPRHRIRTALLWTSAALWMEVNEEKLTSAVA